MTGPFNIRAGLLALAVFVTSAGVAQAASGVATTSLNVRSGPGTGYHVVDVLRRNEAVDIRNCSGGWCYVSHAGADGWASARYLATTTQRAAPPRYAPPRYKPAPRYTPPPRRHYDRWNARSWPDRYQRQRSNFRIEFGFGNR